MATKTITLELDAYERLRKAKRTSRESFSSVVRRAVFPDEPVTAGELLDTIRKRMDNGLIRLSLESLEALDLAQEYPRISDSEWVDTDT